LEVSDKTVGEPFSLRLKGPLGASDGGDLV